MAKQKKQEEESSGESCPLWILSFADMMSLLMAFFVMLSTFSTFGPKAEQQLKGVLQAALAPYGGYLQRPPKTGLGPRSKTGQTPEGSERPTLEQTFSTDTMVETGPKDFRTHKVFLTESKNVFWSNGCSLSKQGKDYLTTMAEYWERVRGRIVLNEAGPGEADIGLPRCVIIAEFLVSKGMPRESINIAASSLMAPTDQNKNRMVEISFLDESLYR